MERIVVGVDGSDNSRAALEWAVAEAGRRGASVEAVMAWEDPYLGTMWTAPISFDHDAVEEGRRVALDQILDSTDVQGLPAPIEAIVCRGHAGRTLLDVARGANLLVVGSRGHGGFVGLLLGSVSHQVVSHAPCPVVVVPAAVTPDD